MLATTRANILKPNHSTTAITCHLLFLLVTSYIDILQARLDIAREKSGFLCQEILTQLFIIFIPFGIRFAISIRSKSLRHKHLRQKSGRKIVVSPYATRLYIESMLLMGGAV
jgi:hypothetical protein